MSINETDKCPICNEFKNSMLQLECYHDPCLACAAQAYTHQKAARQVSTTSSGQSTVTHKEIYVCTMCGQKTSLNRDTAKELDDIARRQDHVLEKPSPSKVIGRNLTKSPSKSPIVPRGYIEETSRENMSSDRPARRPVSNLHEQSSIDLLQQLTRSKSKGARRIRCRTHLQEEVSYYCLDCLENICAECAINGIHRGHRAKTTKKAMPEILKEFDLLIESAEHEFEYQKRQKHDLSKSVDTLGEQTANHKGQISKQFQLFHEALQGKERDILQQVDEIQQRNLAVVKNEIDLLGADMQLSMAFIEEVKKTLKLQELSMLGQFAVKRQFLQVNIVKAGRRRQPSQVLSAVRAVNVNEVRLLVQKVMEQISQFRLSGGYPAEKSSKYRRPDVQRDNTERGFLQQLDYSAG